MRKTLAVLGAVFMLAGVLATSALADDDFVPDETDVAIDTDVDPLTFDVTITLVTGYFNPGQDDQCQLQGGGHFVEASVTSSDESVATVAPSPITFDACGESRVITITAVGCGTATVTVSAEDWTARTGPNAVFNEGEILVTVTAEDCDNGGDDLEVCAEPAAPAWANAILQANNYRPKGKAASDYGNLISKVAGAMEQGATFGGYAKHEAGYAEAVWDFLKTDGRAGSLPIGPAGAARPGWHCETV